MKEFIEKLIGRLEEKFKYNSEQAEIWRNGSDKDAYSRGQKDLYMDRANTYGEVMRIVNQLAEEYNNDFCEWKKTDKSKYSPYHHALKHGNITLEFHDDFKFCPYCGKKIKVVE